MLRAYIAGAMRRARFEVLADDGSYYGEIPGFLGVYANASTPDACRALLEQVLEDWILVRVSKNLSLPVVDGIELAVKEVR